MLIDVDGLEGNVKPQIENTRKYLELGKSSINSINIPSDFSYQARIRNISQTISNIDGKVNNIGKWLDTTIKNFTKAETDNKGLIEGLIDSMPTSLISGGLFNAAGNVASLLSTNTLEEEIRNSVTSAFDYIFSGDWITDSTDMAKQTASKVSETVKLAYLEALETGAKIKDEISSFLSDKVVPALETVGAKISEAWEFTYEKIITPVWNFIQATGASIANVVIGLVKGIGQLIESLLDFVVLIGTAVGSILTGIADGITYLIALTTGKTDEWSSYTKVMWKDTMAYVAEDHVGNAFKSFYANSVVGQWLDEKAIDIFKSEGTGTQIASGIGYVAGIVLLTLATFRSRNSSNRCCDSF